MNTNWQEVTSEQLQDAIRTFDTTGGRQLESKLFLSGRTFVRVVPSVFDDPMFRERNGHANQFQEPG